MVLRAGAAWGMTYIIDPPVRASLAVKDSSERFALRRVFCVGRNYGAHAREMGHDPDREPPFFFCKPADAMFDVGEELPYPPLTKNLHHEVELVVFIGEGGENISVDDANACIFGYGIGLDMTRRDLQSEAKKLGRPWDWGKAFDLSAPCGPVHLVAKSGLIEKGNIWLDVNGERRQAGNIADLIWSIREVISIISQSMALKPGDAIMTGTPAGVGPVSRGDEITAGLEGLGTINTTVS